MKEINQFSIFSETNPPKLGLALIFDISGFSNFFNKPDLQYYITDYINHIIECVEINIWGGNAYWNNNNISQKYKPLDLKPCFRKYLGDGMLYVWEYDEHILFDDQLKLILINRLYNLQTFFKNVNRKLLEQIPTADLPSGIKFGLAKGTVYRIVGKDGNIDYIGPCINLASRLVKYCKEINFIASARLDIPTKEIAKQGYMKIIAKDLRNFEKEIIIIDSKDYQKVNKDDKLRLFQEIP